MNFPEAPLPVPVYRDEAPGPPHPPGWEVGGGPAHSYTATVVLSGNPVTVTCNSCPPIRPLLGETDNSGEEACVVAVVVEPDCVAFAGALPAEPQPAASIANPAAAMCTQGAECLFSLTR